MRNCIRIFSVLLICAVPTCGQGQSDDPYELKFVQANLHNASTRSGVDISAIAKNFQRLGDGVSIALIKILDERDLMNPQTVNDFLPLIRQSFSYPSIISIETNKQPKVTLFLLKHLQANMPDVRVRAEVQRTIEFVRQKTST